MSYIGNSPGLVTRQKFQYIATAGQTNFGGVDINGLTMNYTPRAIDVFVNGRYIPESDFVAVNSSNVIFSTGLTATDEVIINAIGTYTIADVAASGGGMFKGDLGTTGNRPGDIFRITEQQLDLDVTIGVSENASAPGPITIATGVTLTINSGGNLVIL